MENPGVGGWVRFKKAAPSPPRWPRCAPPRRMGITGAVRPGPHWAACGAADAPATEQLRPPKSRVPRWRLLAAGPGGPARTAPAAPLLPARAGPPPGLHPRSQRSGGSGRGRPPPAFRPGGADAGRAEPAGRERGARTGAGEPPGSTLPARRAPPSPHPPARAAGPRPLTFGAADLPTPSGGNESCPGVSPRSPLAARTCEAPPRSPEGGSAPARVRPVALSSSSFH